MSDDSEIPIPTKPISETPGPKWTLRADQVREIALGLELKSNDASIDLENRGQGYFRVHAGGTVANVLWPLPAAGQRTRPTP